MGVITRFFECKNKNCHAENKRWDNDNYQEEIQNCPNKKCKRPTKAYRAVHRDKLFGEFKCEKKRKGKICGNEWFSGNAYFNTWQKCQKCHNKCKPYYLKEHDESNGVVTKPHPDRLCQKCMEFKEETGNSFARCDGREDYFVDENLLRERAIMMKKAKKIREEERRLEESKKRKEAEKKEHKRREEEDKKKKEGKKELAKENFKSSKSQQKKVSLDKKPNKTKYQNDQSQDLSDDDYWDSDNEEDRENWFYTADEVYFDAPFRLQDYKIKLDSGSVKEAPSCEPYRQLYFLHLAVLSTGKQSNDKKKKARNMFNNLYSVQIQKIANKNKKLTKKELANKAKANSPSKNKSDDNKENTNSAKNNSISTKSQQKEASLEDKMAALTVTSSQKATRTSTSSRRVLKQL
ncbi:unnamed protein product [Oikopleura dioica]|uniref:Uncharacterized protein n=1 Tax=Oikopleura dioica TaxID=34765 RepID=E4YT93_OIKDI|nr:unnamed protein product [Oikopleura dioica]